ncbi:MAG: DUF721 domain-containing protein [Acidobacteria bacterium]|nr:DUF721 domain-containing protein [Acidobacteriota bacterium]
MDRAFDILFSLQRGTSRHGLWVVECLKGSWPRLVGDKLAAICRPANLKDTVLTVEVTDGAWLDTVRGLQAELQDKLSSVTGGEVKKLKIFHKS